MLRQPSRISLGIPSEADTCQDGEDHQNQYVEFVEIRGQVSCKQYTTEYDTNLVITHPPLRGLGFADSLVGMGRIDLERLSREELIELVLRLQRPDKTSRTSSKPPATDHKERRERSKPGGAKPGHEGHSRAMSDDPDAVVDHRPAACACCGGNLNAALSAEVVSVSEQIELPAVAPIITQHRRLAVRCPSCGTRVVAPVPEAARGTPFGPRLHAVATYLKTFQALSYERLQAALSDLFGLTLSQGGLMNLLRRAQAASVPVARTPSRPYAGPQWSHPMRPACASRAATPIIGSSIRRKPWCTRPPRRAAPSWCGR